MWKLLSLINEVWASFILNLCFLILTYFYIYVIFVPESNLRSFIFPSWRCKGVLQGIRQIFKYPGVGRSITMPKLVLRTYFVQLQVVIVFLKSVCELMRLMVINWLILCQGLVEISSRYLSNKNGVAYEIFLAQFSDNYFGDVFFTIIKRGKKTNFVHIFLQSRFYWITQYIHRNQNHAVVVWI